MGLGTPAVLARFSPMLTSAFRSFLMLAMLSMGALSAHAQLVFTVTGTAVGTAGGYNNGQSYTFIYTVGSSVSNPTNSSFTGQANFWGEELSSDHQLYTAVGGSGVVGTFVRPAATSSDPFSQLIANSSTPALKLLAASDSSSIGLTTPDATPIKLAAVTVTSGVSVFNPISGGYTEPAAYFSTTNSFLGSYPSAVGNIQLQTAGPGGNGFATIEFFTITGFAIAGVAIPEPSTSAALLGLGALGLAVYRRRGVRVG